MGSDAGAPREVAQRIETVDATKARMITLPRPMLEVLAGPFVGLASLFFNRVRSDAAQGFAAGQVLGGVVPPGRPSWRRASSTASPTWTSFPWPCGCGRTTRHGPRTP